MEARSAGLLRPIVDVSDLTLFQMVVDRRSFRQAAHALGTQTSGVSRKIRALEDRLGASLFERSHSGVQLTSAGERFRDDSMRALVQLDNAVRAVGRAGVGGDGTIAIGVVGSLSAPFIDRQLRLFRAEHPAVALRVIEGGQRQLVAAVRERLVDVAFVIGAAGLQDVETEALWTEQLTLALASSDPRAQCEQIDVDDLVDDLFVISAKPPGPEIYELLIRALSQPGFSPMIVSHDVGREGLMLLVGLGFGVSLVCSSQMRVRYPNVSVIPLRHDKVTLSAIWSSSNDNPALRRFLSLARRLSRE